MNIKVTFNAQLRDMLGCADGTHELADGSHIDALYDVLRAGPAQKLFDEHGKLMRAVIVFHNDKQVMSADKPQLAEGDLVNFLTPIAGG